jgi:predicted anti-sigma-YlaC factor YlaD
MSFDEIVCREFAELATDYLDGAMPEPTLELVEEHLAMCDWCRDYLHQIRTTAEVVADAEDDGPRFAPAEPVMQQLVGAFRRRRQGGPPR